MIIRHHKLKKMTTTDNFGSALDYLLGGFHEENVDLDVTDQTTIFCQSGFLKHERTNNPIPPHYELFVTESGKKKFTNQDF